VNAPSRSLVAYVFARGESEAFYTVAGGSKPRCTTRLGPYVDGVTDFL
jgi:hypothetical protein